MPAGVWPPGVRPAAGVASPSCQEKHQGAVGKRGIQLTDTLSHWRTLSLIPCTRLDNITPDTLHRTKGTRHVLLQLLKCFLLKSEPVRTRSHSGTISRPTFTHYRSTGTPQVHHRCTGAPQAHGYTTGAQEHHRRTKRSKRSLTAAEGVSSHRLRRPSPPPGVGVASTPPVRPGVGASQRLHARHQWWAHRGEQCLLQHASLDLFRADPEWTPLQVGTNK